MGIFSFIPVILGFFDMQIATYTILVVVSTVLLIIQFVQGVILNSKKNYHNDAKVLL